MVFPYKININHNHNNNTQFIWFFYTKLKLTTEQKCNVLVFNLTGKIEMVWFGGNEAFLHFQGGGQSCSCSYGFSIFFFSSFFFHFHFFFVSFCVTIQSRNKF